MRSFMNATVSGVNISANVALLRARSSRRPETKSRDLLFKAFLIDQTRKALLNETQNLLEDIVAERLANAAREQFVNLAIHESRDGGRGLLALEHRRDVLREPILQRRDGVENRRARLRRQRVDERRVNFGEHVVSVNADEIFDLALKETRFKERVKNSLLRNQLVADRVANRFGQLRPVPRNHALRPDGDAEKFHRLVRMKQHPDRQPRRAKAVNRSDDDDRDADEEFEGKRIQDSES